MRSPLQLCRCDGLDPPALSARSSQLPTSDLIKMLIRSVIAGALILATSFVYRCDPAEAYQPVRSLLEIRHNHVIIQKWGLSCGAAALATVLHDEFGEPVTEKTVAEALMSRAE